MAWQINGTPITLSGLANSLIINDLVSTIYNVLLNQIINANPTPQTELRLGFGSIDTTNNYATRLSRDGATDVLLTNDGNMVWAGFVNSNPQEFNIGWLINVATEEKPFIGFSVYSSATGSGTAPGRQVNYGKWGNIADQFDQVEAVNASTGDYGADSNFSALGTD